MTHNDKERFLLEHNRLSLFSLQSTLVLLTEFKEANLSLFLDNDWPIGTLEKPFTKWLAPVLLARREKQLIDAYENYSDAIFRYCYYRSFDKESANDFVQETYSKTWKYIFAGNEVENIRAFLYKIVKNVIIDDLRKKKISSLDYLMEKGFTPGVDTRQKTEDHFVSQEIMEIIKSLSEKYRDVMMLKYINDFSTKEIAFRLHETENSVYIKTSRGIKKVREILRDQESKLNSKK